MRSLDMRTNKSTPERTELLGMLRTRAFEKRPVTLASGRSSNFYIDCKQVTLDARAHVLIGRQFLDLIRQVEAEQSVRFSGAGGLTMGADPLASAVAMTSSLDGHPLPAFLVRKEPKKHGTESYIEGVKNLAPGGSLVVLEDVVTTGGSALQAVERVRNAGFQVSLVVGLVDRLEGGRERLQQEGLRLETLFDRRDFLADDES
jgi:orotate phosphoribosyltransferase